MRSKYALEVQSNTRDGELWLHSREWDLTFMSLSAGLVLFPFVSYEIFNSLFSISPIREFLKIAPQDVLDISRNTVNGIIALLVGGPHMYATFTRTFFDGAFRREHPSMILSSLIIPPTVVLVGIFQFRWLITFFFFWASIHIMQQAGYIVKCYNNKLRQSPTTYSKALDYILLFSSLFPFAIWRMIHGEFKVGKIELVFPDFIQINHSPILSYSLLILVTMVFATTLTLWVLKSYSEYQSGTLHKPKSLFILLTAGVAFFIPSYRELDVAFQGFNAWHSFQYLGLTWYINSQRKIRDGRIENTIIDHISNQGQSWKFYFFNVALALGTIGVITLMLVTRNYTGLSFDQAYYIVILSFLLIHYYQDQYLFRDNKAIV